MPKTLTVGHHSRSPELLHRPAWGEPQGVADRGNPCSAPPVCPTALPASSIASRATHELRCPRAERGCRGRRWNCRRRAARVRRRRGSLTKRSVSSPHREGFACGEARRLGAHPREGGTAGGACSQRARRRSPTTSSDLAGAARRPPQTSPSTPTTETSSSLKPRGESERPVLPLVFTSSCLHSPPPFEIHGLGTQVDSGRTFKPALAAIVPWV
jgi:hypothetical protein